MIRTADPDPDPEGNTGIERDMIFLGGIYLDSIIGTIDASIVRYCIILGVGMHRYPAVTVIDTVIIHDLVTITLDLNAFLVLAAGIVEDRIV